MEDALPYSTKKDKSNTSDTPESKRGSRKKRPPLTPGQALEIFQQALKNLQQALLEETVHGSDEHVAIVPLADEDTAVVLYGILFCEQCGHFSLGRTCQYCG